MEEENRKNVRKVFDDAMDLRNHLFIQRAITGQWSESDQLIYDFLEEIGREYVKLTDELHVLKPFKIFIGRGDLNS